MATEREIKALFSNGRRNKLGCNETLLEMIQNSNIYLEDPTSKLSEGEEDKSVGSNRTQNDLSSITHIEITSDVDQKSPYEKCEKDECLNQREILTHIFDQFELQVSDNHECSWGGVSCNDDEQVNHIWFGKTYNCRAST